MELLNGSGSKASESVTGFLCYSTAALLFTPGFQPLAAATGIGCGIGLWANW